MAVRSARPLHQEIFLVLIYIRGWLDPTAIMRLEGLGQLRNSVPSPGIESCPMNVYFCCWCRRFSLLLHTVSDLVGGTSLLEAGSEPVAYFNIRREIEWTAYTFVRGKLSCLSYDSLCGLEITNRLAYSINAFKLGDLLTFQSPLLVSRWTHCYFYRSGPLEVGLFRSLQSSLLVPWMIHFYIILPCTSDGLFPSGPR
jgi:hypothetical protein